MASSSQSSIHIFKSEAVFQKSETKLNAVDHLHSTSFVFGDKKGYLYLMENSGISGREAKRAAEPMRVSKSAIDKIVSLSSDRLLACVLSGGILILVDFGQKKSIKIMDNVVGFSYFPGDQTPNGRSKFLVTQKRKCVAFILDLNAEKLKTVFRHVNEFAFPNTPDVAVWHKNSISVGFEGKEYSILDFKTGISKEKISDFVKILEDDPIIRVIDEDEILFLTQVGKDYLGIFFGSDGKPCSKSNLMLTSKGISDIIPTNKHIIILEKDHTVQIFSKKDVQHLQTVKLRFEGKYSFLSNSMEDVYICTRFKVFFLKLQGYEDQINECLDKCKGKKALSIFDSFFGEGYKNRDLLLTKLNHNISYAYLEKKRYNEALDHFANSAFDPIELLEREFPDSLQGHNSSGTQKKQYYKKEPLNFLISVFKKKRRQILIDYPNPEQENINKMHTQGREIKASVWLECIDYALIKCMIEIKEYKMLANFFKSAKNIYCRDIHNEVEVFVKCIEDGVSDRILRHTILAFLYEIVSAFSKCLDNWKQVSILSGLDSSDNSHFINSIRILISCQSDKSQFFNLLSQHASWLAKGDYMSDLFNQVRVDTILPEEIHRRLLDLNDVQPEYMNSILESFYDVMIHKHNLRTERYHTELAKLYLKYIFESKKEQYYLKLHFFLRESFANYEGNEIRERIEEYVEEHPDYIRQKILVEEIFLLGREKRHDIAIKRLLDLKNYEMAEKFCCDRTDGLLTTLFKEYIKIYEKMEDAKEKEEMHQRIRIFLLKFSTHNELDPAEILKAIPDDWLLSDDAFLIFLESSLSKSDHLKKNMKAKRQLSEINLQNSSYKLVKAQKAWIKITERDKCNVCVRKIGDKVFDVYPNGVIIIHTCMNKNSPYICPNTGQNFSLTFNF